MAEPKRHMDVLERVSEKPSQLPHPQCWTQGTVAYQTRPFGRSSPNQSIQLSTLLCIHVYTAKHHGETDNNRQGRMASEHKVEV